MAKVCVLAAVVVSVIAQVYGLNNVITYTDQRRMAALFEDGLKRPELSSLFYSVMGLKSIGKDVPEAETLCDTVAASVDLKNTQSLHMAAAIWKQLSCKFTVPKSEATLSEFIQEGNDVATIADAVATKALFGMKVGEKDIGILESALKKDDTPSSAGHAFYAASLLPKTLNVKNTVEMVEDIVAQADEIDSSMLQFDGGLDVTACVIRGIALLSQREGRALLTQDQAIKFAQYLVNRKYVVKLRDAYNLLSVLSLMSDNEVQIPVVVSVFKSNIINDKNPVLKLRVTNLLDKSLPGAKVTAVSMQSEDNLALLENVVLSKGPDDDYVIIDAPIARGYIAASTFVLDVMSKKPSRGMYSVTVNVDFQKNAKKFVGVSDITIKAKVVTKVIVDGAEVSVVDKDRSTSPSPTKVKFPDKLTTDLEADYHQKILMKFSLKDTSSGELVTAHQVFIRLTHVSTGQEIFFVAEPEDTMVYKFTLDIGATGKDSFNNLSGKYKMDLIVGDSAIQIPIKWHVGAVALTFSEEPRKTKKMERTTGPKPEIEHMFRVPEKRPPKVISNAFTGLLLVPFLLMFALWIKVGANLSNFSFSISTLMFHIGLAGIFILYFFFWHHLNMFQTLRYLAVIGGITFLGGNKMLADIASKKQSRS